MRPARLALTVGITMLLARSGSAQSAYCATVQLEVRDACATVEDFLVYLTPQLGVALTGGNTILVQGGTSGSGSPRFSFGARANVIVGNVPIMQTPAITGAQNRTVADPYPTVDKYLVLPTFDLVVRIYRGHKVGLTRVGGLDLLGSAALLPALSISVDGSAMALSVSTPIQGGFGGRFGLLEETSQLPGIAVSGMWRRLPTATLTASLAADSLRVADLSLTTVSWRLTTGKSFVFVRIAGGIGQDYYDSAARAESIINRAAVGRVTTGEFDVSSTMTRNNVFADASINLPGFRLAVEAGLVDGGRAATAHVFDIDAVVKRSYGSIGVRVPF